MAEIDYAGQVTREAPEIEAYKLGLLQEAKRLYGQPMAMPAVEAAGMSPAQQQALDLARQGIGSFEPYLQAGTQVLTQGIAGLQGASQMYDPTSAKAFMDPYQREVTQGALEEMRRQADISRQGQAAQAVGAGAFGGTREGVQRAEFERGVQGLMQQRIMEDYSRNFQQAQQEAQKAFESQQLRQLSAAQGMGQAGLQYGQFGEAAQRTGAADVAQLAELGGIERLIAQQQLDAMRQTQLQEQMAPYQQLAFASDIYRGAPSTQMTLTSQSTPSASPLQTAAGYGIAGLSAISGAQKAGLFS